MYCPQREVLTSEAALPGWHLSKNALLECLLFYQTMSQGSSVSIVTDYGVDNQFDPLQRQRIFLLVPASRPALGPTQSPVQWVLGVLFPGVKQAQSGHDAADHSPPFSAEVKNEWELYLIFPHAPPWHVAGQLYFFFCIKLLREYRI
jgi:hypothetical protein